MKLYLAGPMRGIPFFNFPAFKEAAAALRAKGHYVFNPAERDEEIHGEGLSEGNEEGCEAKAVIEHGFSLRRALREDLAFICDEAEGIAVLPGWEGSRGCQAEMTVASALDLPIIFLPIVEV